jgi:hypothetical protein
MSAKVMTESAIKQKRKNLKGRSRNGRLQIKAKRNLGQEYVTEKGKVARGRKFKQLDECRLKCKQ